jgi:hypothetical protein
MLHIGPDCYKQLVTKITDSNTWIAQFVRAGQLSVRVGEHCNCGWASAVSTGCIALILLADICVSTGIIVLILLADICVSTGCIALILLADNCVSFGHIRLRLLTTLSVQEYGPEELLSVAT